MAARWVVFPSLDGDWGLGPTFITDSCTGCHVAGGRGSVNPDPAATLVHQLVRLSVPGPTSNGGPRPHPNYGSQLKVFGVQVGVQTNRIPAEGKAFLDWRETPVGLPDGETVMLREPRLRTQDLNFGPLGDTTMTSVRNTQALIGLGFLEAVPDATIRAMAADQARLGLRGRPNVVYDQIGGHSAIGRFGWKANEPSVPQQIAGAFHEDTFSTSCGTTA